MKGYFAYLSKGHLAHLGVIGARDTDLTSQVSMERIQSRVSLHPASPTTVAPGARPLAVWGGSRSTGSGVTTQSREGALPSSGPSTQRLGTPDSQTWGSSSVKMQITIASCLHSKTRQGSEAPILTAMDRASLSPCSCRGMPPRGPFVTSPPREASDAIFPDPRQHLPIIAAWLGCPAPQAALLPALVRISPSLRGLYMQACVHIGPGRPWTRHAAQPWTQWTPQRPVVTPVHQENPNSKKEEQSPRWLSHTIIQPTDIQEHVRCAGTEQGPHMAVPS